METTEHRWVTEAKRNKGSLRRAFFNKASDDITLEKLKTAKPPKYISPERRYELERGLRALHAKHQAMK